MLLPSVVARVWLMSGDTANAVPIVVGLFFFAALVGLFVSTVAILRGTVAAAVGGVILLSLQPLLYWAASQYADVPLACLMTAAWLSSSSVHPMRSCGPDSAWAWPHGRSRKAAPSPPP